MLTTRGTTRGTTAERAFTVRSQCHFRCCLHEQGPHSPRTNLFNNRVMSTFGTRPCARHWEHKGIQPSSCPGGNAQRPGHHWLPWWLVIRRLHKLRPWGWPLLQVFSLPAHNLYQEHALPCNQLWVLRPVEPLSDGIAWACVPKGITSSLKHLGYAQPKISQAKILEWVAISSSTGSSRPKDWTCISCASCIAGGFFTTEQPQREVSSS